MISATDALLQFLGTAKNPLVVGVCLVVTLINPTRLAIRGGTISIASAWGALDAIEAESLGEGLALIAIGAMAGAFVAEVALALVVPAAFFGLGVLRTMWRWLRNLR